MHGENQEKVVLSRGIAGDVRWEVDVTTVSGKTCLIAMIEGRRVGTACSPDVSSDIPLNFAVDGTGELLVIYGAVAPEIRTLNARTVGETKTYDIPIIAIAEDKTKNYFAYAVRPGAAADLIGFDSTGGQIVSGATKLLDVQQPG